MIGLPPLWVETISQPSPGSETLGPDSSLGIGAAQQQECRQNRNAGRNLPIFWVNPNLRVQHPQLPSFRLATGGGSTTWQLVQVAQRISAQVLAGLWAVGIWCVPAALARNRSVGGKALKGFEISEGARGDPRDLPRGSLPNSDCWAQKSLTHLAL